MEVARHRKIKLLQVDDFEADLRTACGVRAKGKNTSMVLYRRRPTPNQTEHVILHELAHEWLDHGTSLGLDEVARLITAESYRRITDALGPDVVIQGRSRYASREEREAEMSASLIRLRSQQPAHVGTDSVSLLESSLSHPLRRGDVHE